MDYDFNDAILEHGLMWRKSDIEGESIAIPLLDAEGNVIGTHDDEAKEYLAYITAYLSPDLSAFIDKGEEDYRWNIAGEDPVDERAHGYAKTKDEAQFAVYEKAKELKLI